MFQEKGQVSLSLVFLVGGLVVLMAVSLAFLILTFINAGYGFRAANQALAVSGGGVSDALLILERNKGYGGTYSLPLGNYSANVTVTQNPAAKQATIVSSAVVQGYQRKIQAVAAVDPASGQVDLLSWTALTL